VQEATGVHLYTSVHHSITPPPPAAPYPITRLLPNFLPLVVFTRHNKHSTKHNVNRSSSTSVISKRVASCVPARRLYELTKRFLKVFCCDNQASVLDTSECLGFFYETVFQTFFAFVFRWNRRSRHIFPGPILKSLSLSIDSFKRLHLSHMEVKNEPVFERLYEALYGMIMKKKQNS
jgi:hypothetical protein